MRLQVPVTSIALLPVELSTFEGCKRDAAHHAGKDTVVVEDGTLDDDDQNVALSQSKGRYPFSRPPLARPALVSRDGVSTPPPPIKSYMLMVGYNQVQLYNLLQ